MDQTDEMMKKALLDMITGPCDFVPKEYWLDPETTLQWITEHVLNATECTESDGYYFPPAYEAETAKHAYHKFQPRKGDVLVSTYCKTGTTWMSEIVRNIFYLKDKELLAKAKKLQQFYSYLEVGPVSKFQVLDNLQLPRRSLGTHLPAALVNMKKLRENDTKILYVIRNPKDQAVSWYHFARSLPYAKKEPWTKILPENEKEFYDRYFTGHSKAFGKEGEGYLEHVRGWYDHINDSNVMFLVYEEMKQDIHKEISKIAKFIDVDLTEEEVDQVVQNTSFQHMKKQMDDKTKDSTELVKLFRKGEVGGWKNHLTVAQSELVDANVERVLGDTDIKFIYEFDNE